MTDFSLTDEEKRVWMMHVKEAFALQLYAENLLDDFQLQELLKMIRG